MKNRFDFKSAVAIIDRVDHEGNAIPFDVTFRTFQKFSKTGGKHLEYNQVKKLRSKKYTPSEVRKFSNFTDVNNNENYFLLFDRSEKKIFLSNFCSNTLLEIRRFPGSKWSSRKFIF